MKAVATVPNYPLDFTSLVRGPFIVGSTQRLSDELATRFVQLMQSDFETLPKTTLGGRGQSSVCDVEELGRVFVKRYTHGGLLRRLTGGKFLCVGPCRSQAEFMMLELVRSLGVSAPKPLVYVKKGSYFYSTWLVMEHIPNTRTLVDVSQATPEVVPVVMERLAEQLRILLRNRVLHVDLHPGNVLIHDDLRVTIVDFDKAYIYPGSAEALCDLYLRRWRRAVIKHSLAPILSELISLTLRSYHE